MVAILASSCVCEINAVRVSIWETITRCFSDSKLAKSELTTETANAKIHMDAPSAEITSGIMTAVALRRKELARF